jgi:hypothetical protein
MDWNAFIIPAVLILVELIKLKLKDRSWLPYIAVGLGIVLGIVYAVYYKLDLFVHIFQGGVYGAAASGIYDGLKPVFEKFRNSREDFD